jgi:hypothetical protein
MSIYFHEKAPCDGIRVVPTVLSDNSVVYDVRVDGFLIHATSASQAEKLRDNLIREIETVVKKNGIGLTWLEGGE